MDFLTAFSYLVAVFIAVAFCVLVAYLTVNFLGRRYRSKIDGGNLYLIESMPLEPRRTLHLVKVCQRVLLIGSSDGGITLLAEVDEDRIKVECWDKKRKPPGASFLSFLKGRNQ